MGEPSNHTSYSKAELQLLLSLTDLTSLNGTDNEASITELCTKAKKYGTAAVCVYPALVSAAKKNLTGSAIRVAAVAGGFPHGQLPIELKVKETAYALEQGADEIDMVINRGKFLEGNEHSVFEEVSALKKICGKKILKVILETGELRTQENIRKAAEQALEGGADFLKTSTGKITPGATADSVQELLDAICASGKKAGIKPSGGIAEIATALQFLRMTERMLGKEWISPQLFRLGASKLTDTIYSQLQFDN